MLTDGAQATLFAHALANQAVEHPDWGFDQHVAFLVTAGFSNVYVLGNARAIHEAIHLAQTMRTEGRIK